MEENKKLEFLKTIDLTKTDNELKEYFSFRHDGRNTFKNVLSLGNWESNNENLQKFKDFIDENEAHGLKEIRKAARIKKAGEIP